MEGNRDRSTRQQFRRSVLLDHAVIRFRCSGVYELERKRRKTMSDVVNHPAHYGGDTVYETIKVIEAWRLNFNLGNAVKYISRAGIKSNSTLLEYLKKAAFYLNREIANIERDGK
jgi:hypothetical protein